MESVYYGLNDSVQQWILSTAKTDNFTFFYVKYIVTHILEKEELLLLQKFEKAY